MKSPKIPLDLIRCPLCGHCVRPLGIRTMGERFGCTDCGARFTLDRQYAEVAAGRIMDRRLADVQRDVGHGDHARADTG